LNLEPGTSNRFLEVSKLIASIVNGLALRTPWRSTCLVKALAAHKMLSRRHVPHSIHFGVNIDPALGMKAHAWLSVGNGIIIGGENAGEF